MSWTPRPTRAVRRALPAALVAVSPALLAAPSASAETQTFDFADPKGVNGITFVLDSELEPFVGLGGGVAGTVTYDPKNPDSFAGSISVAADQLTLVNAQMTDVMHNADWLNVAENAKVTVEFGEVLEVMTEHDDDHGHEHGHDGDDGKAGHEADDDAHEHHHDDGVLLLVEGTLRFAGIEIEKEFEIHATHIPDGGTQRGGGEGDLLVLRSEFVVSRYDLGIMPDMGTEKVAEEVWVIVPIVGYSQ